MTPWCGACGGSNGRDHPCSCVAAIPALVLPVMLVSVQLSAWGPPPVVIAFGQDPAQVLLAQKMAREVADRAAREAITRQLAANRELADAHARSLGMLESFAAEEARVIEMSQPSERYWGLFAGPLKQGWRGPAEIIGETVLTALCLFLALALTILLLGMTP